MDYYEILMRFSKKLETGEPLRIQSYSHNFICFEFMGYRLEASCNYGYTFLGILNPDGVSYSYLESVPPTCGTMKQITELLRRRAEE